MDEDDVDARRSAGKSPWLSTFQTWLPFLTVVGGAMWGLYTYMDHHDAEARMQAAQNAKDAKVRVFEASKPFFEKMLAGFGETARLLGTLVTADPTSPRWNEAADRYFELTHGELRLFTIPDMHSELDAADAALAKLKADPSPENRQTFREASRALLQELNDILSAVYEAHGFMP
jgi:hypothetical protein